VGNVGKSLSVCQSVWGSDAEEDCSRGGEGERRLGGQISIAAMLYSTTAYSDGRNMKVAMMVPVEAGAQAAGQATGDAQ